MVNSLFMCPRKDSNLHASRHTHLKRARLPFRHLGFCGCKNTKNISMSMLMMKKREKNLCE